ncbi:hypothetical protein ACFFTM_08745 [Pseudoduganella plicata]|uniref:Uncharacterized protein n=1 Tax=Pseudoduganella plicata TaxID=321984 RepID=A0A4P7BAH7_9BURK|nr:hypothetical protein [Pseudoduganella plicata]QBQ35434.1 hypothetical protein E1742_04075 [Pseudoduganella plicata]GGZ01704.1 hypothetical protein GCM10007388_39290 [Pseudoduganella plicata]
MEELMNRLSHAAEMEGAVAQAVLDSGLRLLVYPLAQGRLAALGWPAASGRQVQGETLLRRRSADLARYGDWLPALFNDGGWYVVRRLAVDGNGGTLDEAALAAAMELLQ